MAHTEEDYLLLSGIQHFSFCRRQWALIHIEQQWEENLLTVEGRILHERAHDPYRYEKRRDLIISRSLPVFSQRLGIRGVCDIVEFRQNDQGVSIFGRDRKYIPFPVEYKRGLPKQTDADILQLTAQSMCLEEMFVCEIIEGYLYYGEIGRREKVVFDMDLRKKVSSMFKEMHEMYKRRYTPKVKTGKHCRSCSLSNICLPKLCKERSATTYIKNRIKEEGI